jgi:ribosomal protein L25 (general stress protein Ctc)
MPTEETIGTGQRPSQELGTAERHEIGEFESPRVSEDLIPAAADAATDTNGDNPAIAHLQAEHKAAETRWQEELHLYIERIDALQSKLKYLAKEAAESARKAAATAEPGSLEKQLREKDEKIALLFEEGQKLSKSEMDHRTAIKKLRQQLADNAKIQMETKKKTEKLERDLANFEARAKRAEAAEKRASESLSSQAKVARDLEAVTNERNALSQTIQEMKAQLARAVARAEGAEAKAASDALEKEKQRTAQLEEELASVKIEREIKEEKLRREVADLKEGIEQEKEKARILEAELKGEQSILESKMESLRARAEEASSGSTGETQAKLLRQIETLQTQYAVASENWQTLEGSLLSRLANVEKERDDIARREGELRRKMREVVSMACVSVVNHSFWLTSAQNLKAKRLEEELENAKETQHDLESKLEAQAQEIQKLVQKLRKAEDDLVAAQKDFAEQKKVCDATWAQKLEDERMKWREHALSTQNSLQEPRTQSPVALSRRPSNLDTTGASLSDYRPTSRRSSTLLTTSSDLGTPPRQNSLPVPVLSPPMSTSLSNPPIMESPVINFEPDEFFSGSATPATPSAYGFAPSHHSRGINDIISESTVGAGPSVQLVERMSATVRRLESERAAAKDELARITRQRDEARKQVVDLMRESEEKKASDARVQELEIKLEDLDQRYQTTLELLGEKSEQVEELQADIADLKKIYRELVDSTMK